MGSGEKQFRRLGGKSVLERSVAVFQDSPGIDHIVVAVPESRLAAVSKHLAAAGFGKLTAVVAGGTTRQASVAAALEQIPDSVTHVLVHDAVRPFVSQREINDVIRAVKVHGAAATAVPVVDTLRRVSGGVFDETVDRENLVHMQTPQAFRADWLKAAHERAAETGDVATDEVALVQALGHPVHLVNGSKINFKITTPDDWRLALSLALSDDRA